MTVFPAEGSIVEEKDLVVVKLSEITERPAVTGGKTCTDNKSMVK